MSIQKPIESCARSDKAKAIQPIGDLARLLAACQPPADLGDILLASLKKTCLSQGTSPGDYTTGNILCSSFGSIFVGCFPSSIFTHRTNR